MPKMKSNRAAVKRFRRTAKGRYKHRSSFRNHILTKKKQKTKRQLRAPSLIAKSDTKSVKKMLKEK